MPVITDRLGKASIDNNYAVATTVKTTRTVGVAVLEAFDLSKFNPDTPVYFVTYKKTTDPLTGEVSVTNLASWKAIVNVGANTLTSLTLAPGYTDIGNDVGDFIECVPTSYWENSLVDHIRESTNANGTLKAGAVDNAAVVASGILTADRSTAGANIETWRSEDVFDHIAGANSCVWSGNAYGSTRVASCTSGVVYLSGKRLTVAAVTSRTFTASKDVYCDLHDNGDGTAVWVYTDNVTNTASPALTAGNLRGAIVVVGASNIAAATSVNQGQETMVVPIITSVPMAVTDSLGNLICPRDPNRKVLGYRQITSNFATTGYLTGLNVPVIVPANRKIKITFSASEVTNSGAGFGTTVSLIDGASGSGTVVGSATANNGGAGSGLQLLPFAVTTPTTTSKTYSALSAGSGTITVIASSTAPANLVVELA